MSDHPKVSIGMPVFNAERYIEDAFGAILSQSFEDFEVVISDNASTDRTGELCRAYAAKDERFRYVRNRVNVGLIQNFNQAYRLSRGEYFKWAASDDVFGPDYLKKAVDMLDDDPTLILVWAKTSRIDEHGNPIFVPEVADWNAPDSVYSSDPAKRFKKLLLHMWWADGPFYGVIRSSALEQTDLHPPHMSGDQLLLTQLSLLGRFYELQDENFYTRMHPAKASGVKTLTQKAAAVAPKPRRRRGKSGWWPLIRSYPQRIQMYLEAIYRSSLTRRQKMKCYVEVARLLAWWIRATASRALPDHPFFNWARPAYPRRG